MAGSTPYKAVGDPSPVRRGRPLRHNAVIIRRNVHMFLKIRDPCGSVFLHVTIKVRTSYSIHIRIGFQAARYLCGLSKGRIQIGVKCTSWGFNTNAVHVWYSGKRPRDVLLISRTLWIKRRPGASCTSSKWMFGQLIVQCRS